MGHRDARRDIIGGNLPGRRFLVSSSEYIIGIFLLIFFPVCWLLVAGHQLDWFGADPLRYTMLRAALIMAYTGTAMSAGVIAVAVLAACKK